MFSLSRKKESKVKEMGKWVKNKWTWAWDWRRELGVGNADNLMNDHYMFCSNKSPANLRKERCSPFCQLPRRLPYNQREMGKVLDERILNTSPCQGRDGWNKLAPLKVNVFA